jgi:hypothetical protein
MVLPILGANTESASYDIANSARINHNNAAYLSRTISSTGSERIMTVSVWVKRSEVDHEHCIFSNKTSSSGVNAMKLAFFSNNKLDWTVATTGDSNKSITTNALFRDVSAWYHIVATVDTTQGTSSNRMKLYVNGAQVTSLSVASYPSQNDDLRLSNSSYPHTIGEDPRDNTNFDGYIAEMHCLDGTAYDASYFGETNDNGVWVPKEYTGGNYGTNGFYMEFKQTGTSANSSGKGADTSGQDNHFDDNSMDTEDIVTDTPTNNFATGMPTAKYLGNQDVSNFNNGNLYLNQGSPAGTRHIVATFGSANMPFYFELSAANVDQDNDTRVGVVPVDSIAGIPINGEHNQVVYRGDGSVTSTGETALTSQGNISDGTVVGVAIDPDNNAKFYLDGTLTSTISINATYRGPVYIPFFRHNGSFTVEWNFGNPSFSGCSNADANGYGQFKYSVPSGYYALCTKNLAEYG